MLVEYQVVRKLTQGPVPLSHRWRMQNSCDIPFRTSKTSAQSVRGFASAAGELMVQVGFMGESITEGEIAAVLVKEGDDSFRS